jgi:hypothetical protein
VDEGWYPDPAREGAERWWDGAAWTAFTREASAPAPDPDAAPQPRLTGRRIPERELFERPPEPDTRAAAWIAWSPAWITFALLPLALLGMAAAGAALVPVAVVLVMLILMALAGGDARQLYNRGFPHRPNPLWMLLGPVGYLVARWKALGEGRVAIAVCIAQLVVIAGGAFIYQAVSQGIGAAALLQSEQE